MKASCDVVARGRRRVSSEVKKEQMLVRYGIQSYYATMKGYGPGRWANAKVLGRQDCSYYSPGSRTRILSYLSKLSTTFLKSTFTAAIHVFDSDYR